MKEMIEEQIIGCPFDLFKSSVVISQNSYVDFYSMTKSQKISYIEQLFKLTVFGEWLKNTRADLNVAKSEYNITNSKISQLGNTIFDLQTKSDLYDEQQKTKKSKIELYLFNKLAELDEAKKNLGALKPQSDIKNSEFALSVCVEKLSAKTELFRKLSSAIAELTASKTAIIESMNKHKQILDVLCEDCLGKSEELIDMPTMRGKLQDCSEKLERLTGAFNQIKTDIDALKSEELDLRNKIREYGQMQTSYERQQRNIEFFEKECASIREEIEKDCNSENPFGELLEKNKSQLETLKAELSEKYKRISMLSVAEMTFNDSGAKKLIFVDLVKKINELLSYYLARMGASYRVIFSPDFDFEFMTESGPSDFSLFSSGEQQRICLSTMFTFRDLVVGNRISSDFFILDEVLDVGIDENCVHRVCDSIKSLMESMSVKTMIISHNKTVIDKIQSFDNVGTISAIKKDGQTKYEVELP
jgi:DNA repair exonuclease SbcCD ATPase subunit